MIKNSFIDWFVKILLAFSIYTNGKSILRTEKRDNQIHCLHGTRVLSMFWIILGHSYYYAASGLTAGQFTYFFSLKTELDHAAFRM